MDLESRCQTLRPRPRKCLSANSALLAPVMPLKANGRLGTEAWIKPDCAAEEIIVQARP